MSDATGKFITRWKDHRRHGGTTTVKEISSKLVEFHVNPGATAMKLLGVDETTHFLDERIHWMGTMNELVRSETRTTNQTSRTPTSSEILLDVTFWPGY